MDKNEEIKAALLETTKLLEDLQWSGSNLDFRYDCCPDCGAMAPDGYHKGETHTKDCDIMKALKRNKEALNGA